MDGLLKISGSRSSIWNCFFFRTDNSSVNFCRGPIVLIENLLEPWWFVFVSHPSDLLFHYFRGKVKSRLPKTFSAFELYWLLYTAWFIFSKFTISTKIVSTNILFHLMQILEQKTFRNILFLLVLRENGLDDLLLRNLSSVCFKTSLVKRTIA